MAKSKSGAAAVKASRQAAGLKSTSIYVTDAERALWKAVAAERGESLKVALMAGLAALQDAPAMSNEALATEVLRRMRGRCGAANARPARA